MSRQKAKKVAIIQARMTSSRFRGKAIIPLADEPLIKRLVERVERIENIDEIAVAIPTGVDHDPIEGALSNFHHVKVVRGCENNVLERFCETIEATKADIVMRITGDCPLIDPEVSSLILNTFCHSKADYASTDFNTGFPLGFDTEVLEANLLKNALKEADLYEQEHATSYIWRRPEIFNQIFLTHKPDYKFLRLVLDTPKDYLFISSLFDELYAQNPHFGFYDILKHIGASKPENADEHQNKMVYK